MKRSLFTYSRFRNVYFILGSNEIEKNGQIKVIWDVHMNYFIEIEL